MKMGIKEFRERLGEVARGEEPVQLTDRGQVIGVYSPLPRWTPELRETALKAAGELAEWQREMKAAGINTEEWLFDIGLDPWGVPLDQLHDR